MKLCSITQGVFSLLIAANGAMLVGCVVQGEVVAPAPAVVVTPYYYYDPVVRVYYYDDPHGGWRHYPGHPPSDAHYWSGSRPHDLPK